MLPEITLRHEEVYDSDGALLGSEFAARIHTEVHNGLLIYTSDSFQGLAEAFSTDNLLRTIARSDYLLVSESEDIARDIQECEGVRVGGKEISIYELILEEEGA